MRATKTSGFYRHDLDGLRGLAIALVAVFHVWFGRVSGGVDVFLVLSGFFFGGRLMRAALTPSASLAPLLEIRRLVQRLLPALVVVLAASAVLTILVQPETRWETYANQSLASLGYYQNWELFNSASDYLRAGEAVSPLQHIWSMSVQGQFYIASLVLVWTASSVLRRFRSRHLRTSLVVLLSALSITSFVYAILANEADQSTAYYDSFARAWELLVGALAGALVNHVRWPMWIRAVVSAVALAVILSCGVFIDGAKEFPGPWALIPVLATVLVIFSAANRAADLPLSGAGGRMPLPNRLLATAPFVSLGAMAYSLYLWHWPLLIFWLAYTGHSRANLVEGAGVLLVSGVLAWLTTRYVENPLRLRDTGPTKSAGKAANSLRAPLRRPTMVLGSVVTLLCVALTTTSFTWMEHMTAQRAGGKGLSDLSSRDYPGASALISHAKVPQLPMRPTVLEAKDDLPQSTTDGCISDFTNPSVRECTYGSKESTKTIALAGGSHAEHWLTALDLLGKMHGFKVVTYLKMGCPLSMEQIPRIPGSGQPYPQCFDWVQSAMREIVSDKPDFVFTTVTRPRNAGEGDEMPKAYWPIWKTLATNGLKVLGMRDTPWLTREGSPFFPADCLAKGGNSTTCGIARRLVLDAENPARNLPRRFPSMGLLDMSDAVCRNDYCRASEGNVLIYRDSHHMTASYVRTMVPELGRRMAKLTQWW